MNDKINQYVIFLNGPSSSGKTTIAKLLQEKMSEPFVCLGIDHLLGMLPKNCDKKVDIEQYALRLDQLLRSIAISILQAGHHLIIDEVSVIEGSFDRWQKVLAPYQSIFVGVTANLSTLEDRELKRGDRVKGTAKSQHATVFQNKQYDLTINTSDSSASACAEKIISYCLHDNSPKY